MNKKKIFGAAIVAAIVLASGWNISRSMNETTLSDMALENVEALAQEGGGASCTCTKHCGDGVTIATCTGYRYCNCNSGFNHVTCDGLTSSC